MHSLTQSTMAFFMPSVSSLYAKVLENAEALDCTSDTTDFMDEIICLKSRFWSFTTQEIFLEFFLLESN